MALNNAHRSSSDSAKHTQKTKKHGGLVQTMRFVWVSHAYSRLAHDPISHDFSWERSGRKRGLALNRDSGFFLWAARGPCTDS